MTQPRDRRAELIEAFDAGVPLDRAWTPPASWYVEREFFELERAAVLGANWVYACRAEQVAKPGQFVAGHLAGEPWVVVRGSDGVLRALHNVCRHHAAEICAGAGTTDKLVCPYHHWTYDLDGALLKAPELGAARDFQRERMGLPAIAVDVLGPFVFIALEPPRASLADTFGALHARLATALYEQLRFHSSRPYEFPCNWKVYVDNYLDGGYHIAHLHGGLAAGLELANYHTKVFEHYSIQSTRGSGDPRTGGDVVYAWMHPTFMVNRYGPIMDTNLVLPIAVDRTLVVMDFYFDLACSPEFIANALKESERVQREDIAICESVQRGLGSRSYDRGRYSVTRENGMHAFHKLLASDLARSAATLPRA